mmetsp:Transcript_124482/g.398159  ORF Transcript_124482/g.398159 Transcript_124482/m.398159 type:complete len:207 (+) Transcript_124482:526-1146(+)
MAGYFVGPQVLPTFALLGKKLQHLPTLACCGRKRGGNAIVVPVRERGPVLQQPVHDWHTAFVSSNDQRCVAIRISHTARYVQLPDTELDDCHMATCSGKVQNSASMIIRHIGRSTSPHQLLEGLDGASLRSREHAVCAPGVPLLQGGSCGCAGRTIQEPTYHLRAATGRRTQQWRAAILFRKALGFGGKVLRALRQGGPSTCQQRC